MSVLGSEDRNPFADFVHMLLTTSLIIVLFIDIYRLQDLWLRHFTIRLAGFSLICVGCFRALLQAYASVEKPPMWCATSFDLIRRRRQPAARRRVCPDYATLHLQVQLSARRCGDFPRFLEEQDAPPEAVEHALRLVEKKGSKSSLSSEEISSVLDVMEESI